MSDLSKNKMKYIQLTIFIALTWLICGCSGSDPTTPVTHQDIPSMANQRGNAGADSRVEWGLWNITVDPVNMTTNVVPLREGQIHFNILHMLEGWSCTDCVFIDGPPTWNPDGNLLIDIGIRHPYPADRLDLTGRDVRGIAIFPGTTSFPNHTVRGWDEQPQSLLASRYLVNPDGYTTHFNRWTSEEGNKVHNYRIGRMTWPSESTIEGNLHPFRYFYTHEYKRLFYPDYSVVETYELDIDFQQPFTFAYSVDSSWNMPHNWPVTDPITDFDISTNSIEAYQISMTIETSTLTQQAGFADLTLEIFDHQSWESISTITFEAPDLFYGVQSIPPSSFVTFDDEMARYNVTINNSTGYANLEDGGSDLLVVVEDVYMSVVGQDFRAYNIFKLPAQDVTKAWRPREGTFVNMTFPGPTPSGTYTDMTVISNPQEPWAVVPGESMLVFNDDVNSRYLGYNRDFDQFFELAGYPGSSMSWLKPIRHLDAATGGAFGVVSDSDTEVEGEYLVRHCTNMNLPGGIYTMSWYTGSLDDPSPYLENAGDVSGGFGGAAGDPIYSIYLFDTSAGYSTPPYQSLHRIAYPYNNPMEALRTFIPLTPNLSGGAAPYGVCFNYFVAMGVDDNPVGEGTPFAVYIYTAESREDSPNLYSREMDVYRIDFGIPLGLQRKRTYQNNLLGTSFPWPALESPKIADIDVLPAWTNNIYMGVDQYPERNWVAVLYTFNNTASWFIEIFDVMASGPMGTEWEEPIFVIGPFTGHAFAMDVDPENFEIYVLHDDLPTGVGTLLLTCLEYY